MNSFLHFPYTVKLITRSYQIIFILLLFGSYPLALIPPGLGAYSYEISLPTQTILTLLSCSIILCYRPKVSRIFTIGLGVYLIGIIYHLFTGDFSATIAFLGFLFIPFSIAIIHAHSDSLAVHTFFLLWLVLLGYGWCNWFQGKEIIGITGNRNWMAICLVATLPWALYSGNTLLQKGNIAYWLRMLMGMIFFGLTLFLLYRCHSRAAWLAVASYGIFQVGCLVYRQKSKYVFLLYCFLFIGFFFLATFFNQKVLIRAYEQDIRLPVWKSTLALIVDTPWGVGAGNYTRFHTPYQMNSGYHQRAVSTEQTTHPHNEFLHIAASIGIIPALCWLGFLFPLLTPITSKHSLVEKLAQFSAWGIYFHSMLDKPLVQPPSHILGLWCMGICWKRYILLRNKETLQRVSIRTGCCLVIFVTFTVFLIGHTSLQIKQGWHRRLAKLYRDGHDFSQALREYHRSIAFDSHDPRGYYGAGVMAIDKLLQPRLAIAYLEELIDFHPYYAHVNRLLGKAYATIGQNQKAYAYFAQDCQLYPQDIDSFQHYFISLAQQGNLPLMAETRLYLQELYRKKSDQFFSRKKGKKLTEKWFTAVEHHHKLLSLHYANAIYRPMDNTFVDPLFYNLELPEVSSAFDRFTVHDGEYWENIIFRQQLLSQWNTDYLPQKTPSLETINTIVRLVSSQVIENESLSFQFPLGVWNQRQGNSLSYHCLISWILRGIGQPCWVLRDRDTREQVMLLIFWAGEMYHLASGELEFKKETNTVTILSEQRLNDPTKLMYSMFYFPQELFLKNFILSTILKHYDQDIAASFNTIPILDVAHARRQIGDHLHITIPWQEICIPEPFSHYRKQKKNE